jgi:hypothetical protein
VAQDDDVCPKCGNPRHPGGVDCPYCGLVYSRWKPPPPGLAARQTSAGATVGDQAEESTFPAPVSYTADPPAAVTTSDFGGRAWKPPREEEEPPPPPPDTLWEPPPPPVGRRGAKQPSTSAPRSSRYSAEEVEEEIFDTPLTRVLPLSLLVAGLFWLVAQTFLTQYVANGVENPREANRQFGLLTGFDPPEGQQGGTLITWAGWDIVLLEERPEGAPQRQSLELSVWAFHQGSLAGTSSPEALLDKVERVIELQLAGERDHPDARAAGATPMWWRVSERKERMHGERALVRTIAIGAERQGQRYEGARVAALAMTAPDARPVLIVIGGSPTRVTSVLRGYLRRMG